MGQVWRAAVAWCVLAASAGWLALGADCSGGRCENVATGPAAIAAGPLSRVTESAVGEKDVWGPGVGIVGVGRRGRAVWRGALVTDGSRVGCVTCGHWVDYVGDGAVSFEIEGPGGKRVAARLLAWDKAKEVSVLEFRERPLRAFVLRVEKGVGAAVGRGARVLWGGFGTPRGGGPRWREAEVLGRSAGSAEVPGGWLMLSGRAVEGDSGSPVVSRDGELVGVLWGRESGRLWASPAEEVAGVWETSAPSPRPLVQGLGVQGFGIFGNRERGVTEAAELRKSWATYAADVTGLRANVQRVQGEFSGLRASVGDLQARVATAEATVGSLSTRVGELRADASGQVGAVNRANQVDGSQVLSGDTGLWACLGIAGVVVTISMSLVSVAWARARSRVGVVRDAAVVLAASGSPEEARAKCAASGAPVREEVGRAVRGANGG